MPINQAPTINRPSPLVEAVVEAAGAEVELPAVAGAPAVELTGMKAVVVGT